MVQDQQNIYEQIAYLDFTQIPKAKAVIKVTKFILFRHFNRDKYQT